MTGTTMTTQTSEMVRFLVRSAPCRKCFGQLKTISTPCMIDFGPNIEGIERSRIKCRRTVGDDRWLASSEWGEDGSDDFSHARNAMVATEEEEDEIVGRWRKTEFS